MKYTGLFFAALFISLITFSGCGDRGVGFDIKYSSQVTIPSTAGASIPISLPTPDITTNTEQKFENNDVKSKWVSGIYMKDLTLTLSSPPNEDFSFLKSIKIYIKTDNLAEVLIASLDPVPANAGNSISLILEDTNLNDYVQSDEFSLRVEAVTDESILFDHTIDIDMVFNVRASVPWPN